MATLMSKSPTIDRKIPTQIAGLYLSGAPSVLLVVLEIFHEVIGVNVLVLPGHIMNVDSVVDMEVKSVMLSNGIVEMFCVTDMSLLVNDVNKGLDVLV